MTTITKERIELFVKSPLENGLTRGEQMELARIALASLEAEPVAWEVGGIFCHTKEEASIYVGEPEPLYEAPPVTVVGGEYGDAYQGAREDLAIWKRRALEAESRARQLSQNYQHLSELYHAQEKRLFKIAQRIKGPAFDKYAHSLSQAIDVLESAIFGEHEEPSRSAMLNGGKS
ncbi:hypothetical protein MOT25_002841 [Salmonella enterica]|nr:hypothetical protein [Salmonella enterica]